MKKLFIILLVAFIVTSAFVYYRLPAEEPGITGSIDPADGAKKVLAISGTDSVGAVPVSGKFSIMVKPGNWALIVEANPPYKNSVIESVLVLEGHPTDVGVIKLSSK